MFKRLLALTVLSGLSPVQAQEPVRLAERLTAGHLSRVSCRVELAGDLTVPDDKGQPTAKALHLTGTSALEYDERVLSLNAGLVDKTIRLYRRLDFERQLGDEKQHGLLRPEVRRLVLLRMKQAEVPFSPDGPLTWGEIDLVRTDVFAPALTGLLPASAVRSGDRWTAAPMTVAELTDLEQIDDGNLDCRMDQVTTVGGRRQARVTLTGTVRGTNEDGPNRQQLDGFFLFDLESNHISYLSLQGRHILLDKDGKELGRIEGKFVLTRQVNSFCPELSDAALKGVATEPTADNTLLLYDNADLGVRLLHPRRWRLAGVHGRQLALDETSGNGLLITLEPLDQLPTPDQLLSEARMWLGQQKPIGSVKIVRTDPARRLAVGIDQFAMDVQIASQKVQMVYYIVKQPLAGATVTARLLTTDLAAVQKEADNIVRSLTLTRPVVIKPEK